MNRREKARVVAGRVAARIRDVSPEGLGRWAPTWGYIGAPSDAFIDALKDWEKVDSPSTRRRLESAIDALVEGWKEAARQWHDAGRPCLAQAEPGIGATVP